MDLTAAVSEAAGKLRWNSGCGWGGVQQVCGWVAAVLPAEAAGAVVRAAVRSTGAAILGLLADDDGVRGYNLYAIFRLHGDVAGLQNWADTLTQIPALRVRRQPPRFDVPGAPSRTRPERWLPVYLWHDQLGRRELPKE